MSKIPLSILVVFKHQNELFYIIRQNHLRVFPGYCSFPGGKAERKETGFVYGDIPEKYLATAQREMEEELGFDFRGAIESKVIQSVIHIGQAITPDFNPYRFEAQYLLVELSEKPKFILDKNEIKDAFWATPQVMRARFERGELIVIPPMWKISDYILNGRDGQESFDLAVPENEVPCIESIFGVKQFMPLSNTLPPAERTNAFLIGDVLVDPSPRDERELQKLLSSLPDSAVKKVLITHHHGDHHKFAREIAMKCSAQLLLSAYTLERIKELGGERYFAGLQVLTVSEGSQVTDWLGQKVFVYEVPGHDEGQIALAPEGLGWFLAGDLFQGIGTVVIGGREGNMKKYFSTLERVISLRPAALFPSHGIALGGTAILEKTLEHRKHREEQIKQMSAEGLSPRQMLERIYFDIPAGLQKYAMANIESHLKKIEEEK